VVRRDRGDTYLAATVRNYFERGKPKCSVEILQNGCTLLAAQRHVRILGLLGSMAQKDPASPKLEYLPRVESYVSYVLGDLELKAVKTWMTGLGLFS
jgi:aminoglycoside/choline kinase family phosphotransferase